MTRIERPQQRQVLIPAELDEALERISPSELRGPKKAGQRVAGALREYLKSVAGQGGHGAKVAPAGDETASPGGSNGNPGSR